MAGLRRCVLVWALLFAGGSRLLAVSEEGAFHAAQQELRGGFYQRADAQFGAFVQAYTNSGRLAEAILYQAEARLKLGKPAGALELLSTNLAKAGKNTDEYLFYIGEAYAQNKDDRKARDTFGQLVQQFPASTNALKATVEEASACSRLGDWPRVLEVLQVTNSIFQSAVRARPADEFTQRGLLLLSEAWLRQANAPQKFAAAEAALQPLANLNLKPNINWHRQDLLCRILLGTGRTNEALQNTTNLLVAAVQAGARDWQAHSFEFRAGIYESLGQYTNAIDAYTNNLVEGVPDDLKRWALLQSTKLFLAQQKPASAIQTLEQFVAQYSNSPAADVALLTLGELHLGQLVAELNARELDTLPANAPPPTNALDRLQEMVRRFPQSPFTPKAQLDLGWCFWLQGDLTNAQANFQAAAQRLVTAGDQAVAYFKLADTQSRLGQFRSALTNYSLALQKCAALPEVRAALEEPALYQTVHAALEAGELAAATNAMATLLDRFPDGFHTADVNLEISAGQSTPVPRATAAVLLAGKTLMQGGQPSRARAILQDFAARATNAPSLPLVHLALARTWEEEGDWTNAIGQYHLVLDRCGNPDICAEAEFGYAQDTWRAGNPAKALGIYTNFVARYVTHPKAPLAQLWVGDYYFNLGNPSAAELNYQQLYENTNWRGSDLVYQARMMAGRAAFAQNLWKNAINDFTNLTSDVNCPSNLLVEAMFAYGDCEMSQLTKNHSDTNNAEHLKTAVNLFKQIAESYTSSGQRLPALGREADALVQMAQYSGEYAYCTNALSIYRQLITNTTASVSIRSMAAVGSAVALQWLADQKTGAERTDLLRQGLDQCVNVAHSTLWPDEKGDPNWVLKAADMGIDFAATLQEWTQAIDLCKEIEVHFDSLRPRYAEREKSLATRQGNLTRN